MGTSGRRHSYSLYFLLVFAASILAAPIHEFGAQSERPGSMTEPFHTTKAAIKQANDEVHPSFEHKRTANVTAKASVLPEEQTMSCILDKTCTEKVPCRATLDPSQCDEDCFPTSAVPRQCDPSQVYLYAERNFDMSHNPFGGSPEIPSGHDEPDHPFGGRPASGGKRVSILDLYKDEDPDFKKRCIEVMADGSGFCQFMLWTQRGRHGWWRRIQSVQVPPGCWLRLYVDAPSTQELFFAEERAKTENVQPPTRAMISRTRKTPLLRSGAGEPRQMNDNVGLILDKGSKKPMDLHGALAPAT
jgi:hypothetical protein